MIWDFEGNSLWLHRKIGSNPARPWPIEYVVANALNGRKMRRRKVDGCPPVPMTIGGEIWVPRSRSSAADLGHEVYELVFVANDEVDPYAEIACDHGGLAIVVPWPAVEALDCDPYQISEASGLTLAEAARRIEIGRLRRDSW